MTKYADGGLNQFCNIKILNLQTIFIVTKAVKYGCRMLILNLK